MWRFKKEFADAQIVISGMNLVITAKNLTDERAEMIVNKFPQYAHNLENVNPEFKGEPTPGEELAPSEAEVNPLTGKPGDATAGINITDQSTSLELKQAEKAEAVNQGLDAETIAELDEQIADLEAQQNEEGEDKSEKPKRKGKK